MVSSILKRVKSAMWHARRVRDWRPEPPTPTESTLPKGCLTMRRMRHTCSAAKGKSTRSIGAFEIAL